LLAPDRAADTAIGRLQEIVRSTESAIEAERLQRLKSRPVDPTKLERIRSAIEKALLIEPAETPFFKGVQVQRAPYKAAAEWRAIIFNGISKAQLTEPSMESSSSGLDEVLVSYAREMAGEFAWKAFCQRPRISQIVSARANEEAFWREIAPLVGRVGVDPVLVVSRLAEGRLVRQFIRGSATESASKLAVKRRPGNDSSYIVTIEGVDVFGAGLPPGVAWLFSARALQSISYAELDYAEQYVDASFEPNEDTKVRLRMRVRQKLEWATTPVYELQVTNPREQESGWSS
jgi:hypothetical protein